jgi:hypothetical protein
MEVSPTQFEWTTTFDQTGVNDYLADLKKSLRPASPPQEMEVDKLVASDPESNQLPPLLPSRPPPVVFFQQPREPIPLFPKKHG